jgi:flagellar biosynthesis/type III secretory pathway M-ring protein FliF/YscJ
MVAGFGVAIVVAFALVTVSQRDARVALFAAPLRPEQVSEVVERLAEWNVAFVAGAENVEVGARRRNELLLRLSLAGVPHAHRPSTSETLARVNPLTPQSLLDAQQRDGLAGDLATALRGIAGVDDAQVIIAPGRAAAFSDEASAAPSSAVRLRLKPGAQLGRQTIEGIRQFVADGVSGLAPARVAILDDRGLALGENRGASDEAAGLQTSLQSVLDQAFGEGVTIVRVRLDYDRRVRELRNVQRAPLADKAVASASLDERYAADKKLFSRTQRSEDRGTDLHEEKTEIPAGSVQRISVAVAVDGQRKLDLGAIGSLASATLGLVEGRDVLHVEAVSFAQPGRRGAAPLAVILGFVAALAPATLLTLVAISFVRYGAAPFARTFETAIRRLSLTRASRAVAEFPPARVRGALQDEPPHTAAAIISALPAATATAVLEFYPPEERAAIVRRMQREAAPIVSDVETFLRRA